MTHTCTKVTVRQRAIRNNRISLYLDYYPAVRNPETMQMSRREYLGIYIYAHPKNEMEREFNNDMLNKAEAIRCIRVQSLINEEFGFLDKTKQKADFLAYFKKMCRSKDQKWTFVYQHFYNFVNRHSYAVIQISLGTDIYTVSKMLTHKNVSTTQIYADLVNVKKRETANKISLK